MRFFFLRARQKYAPGWRTLLQPGFGRNILAISDQALTAISSFALLLYLSRYFDNRDFGAYSFGFSLFFMAAAIHNSLLTEPMLVFGATRYKSDTGLYIKRVLLIGNNGFGFCVSAILLVISQTVRVKGSAELSDALVGIAIAAPLSLTSVLMRRVCYLQSKIHLAVMGSALALVVMLASVLAASMTGALTLMTAALPMGLASAVAAAYLARRMPKAASAGPSESLRAMLVQHVRYARWSTSSEMIHWLVSNLPVIALPIWFSFEGAGTFKILNLLYMPLYQIVAACMASLIPHLARAAERGTFASLVRSSSRLWVGLAVLYGLVLTGVARPISFFFYGGRYDVGFAWLVLLLVAGILYTLANVHFAALRAAQRPDCVLKAYLVLCCILLSFVPLYPSLGMTAVLASLAAGWGSVCVITTVFVARVAGLYEKRAASTAHVAVNAGLVAGQDLAGTRREAL